MPALSRIALCLGLAAPLPATADMALEFDALTDAFPALPVTGDIGAQYAQVGPMIAGLAGEWMNLTAIAGGYAALPKAETIKLACNKLSWVIEPTGDLGFELIQTSKTGAAKTRFQFTGGVTFLAMLDERSTRRRLFGDNAATAKLEQLYRSLVTSPYLGPVTVMRSGDDLMLMIPEGRPVEIWGRCPA